MKIELSTWLERRKNLQENELSTSSICEIRTELRLFEVAEVEKS
jgi:hypothetical protein